MKIKEVNNVPERYANLNKYRDIIDKFAHTQAKAVEVVLDDGERITLVATKLRNITYNNRKYRHIKVKVRDNNLYLTKEAV